MDRMGPEDLGGLIERSPQRDEDALAASMVSPSAAAVLSGSGQGGYNSR